MDQRSTGLKRVEPTKACLPAELGHSAQVRPAPSLDVQQSLERRALTHASSVIQLWQEMRSAAPPAAGSRSDQSRLGPGTSVQIERFTVSARMMLWMAPGDDALRPRELRGRLQWAWNGTATAMRSFHAAGRSLRKHSWRTAGARRQRHCWRALPFRSEPPGRRRSRSGRLPRPGTTTVISMPPLHG